MMCKILIACVSLAAMVSAQTQDLSNVDPNTLSCDPTGQVFLLLPSFTDCNKFYTCANGEEVAMTCAPGTIFDFALQTCNWPSATKCWLRDPRSEEVEGSGEGSGEWEWDQDTAARAAPALAPSVLDCNDAVAASSRVAYAGDCQRYWRCFNGGLQTVYCSEGLFFNPQTQQCDHESAVRCDVNHEYELNGEFMVYK